jgi:hypothetical protein
VDDGYQRRTGHELVQPLGAGEPASAAHLPLQGPDPRAEQLGIREGAELNVPGAIESVVSAAGGVKLRVARAGADRQARGTGVRLLKPRGSGADHPLS